MGRKWDVRPVAPDDERLKWVPTVISAVHIHWLRYEMMQGYILSHAPLMKHWNNRKKK